MFSGSLKVPPFLYAHLQIPLMQPGMQNCEVPAAATDFSSNCGFLNKSQNHGPKRLLSEAPKLRLSYYKSLLETVIEEIKNQKK